MSGLTLPVLQSLCVIILWLLKWDRPLWHKDPENGKRRFNKVALFGWVAATFSLGVYLALAYKNTTDSRASQRRFEVAQTQADARITDLQKKLDSAVSQVHDLREQGKLGSLNTVFPPKDTAFRSEKIYGPAKVISHDSDLTRPRNDPVMLEKEGEDWVLSIPFVHHPSAQPNQNWWSMMLSLDQTGAWRGIDLSQYDKLMIEAKVLPDAADTDPNADVASIKIRLQDNQGNAQTKTGGTGWTSIPIYLTPTYRWIAVDLRTGFGPTPEEDQIINYSKVMQVIIGQDGNSPFARGTLKVRQVSFSKSP